MEQVCLHDKPIANLHFWSLFPGLKTVDILRSVQLLKVSLGFFWCFVLISATRNNKYADKYNFQQMCWMAGGQCLEGGSNSLCPFSRSVRESSIFIIVTSLPRTSNIPQTSDNKSLYKYVFESPPFFFFFWNLSCRMPIPELLCLFPQEPSVNAPVSAQIRCQIVNFDYNHFSRSQCCENASGLSIHKLVPDDCGDWLACWETR